MLIRIFTLTFESTCFIIKILIYIWLLIFNLRFYGSLYYMVLYIYIFTHLNNFIGYPLFY